MRYVDAHNHVQDTRFGNAYQEIAAACEHCGVVLSAVNGACPDDWPLVLALAREYRWIVPNFGVHPWYINNLPLDWEVTLSRFLDQIPSGVGEAGIDGLHKQFDPKLQEEIFLRQLALAAQRNVPISIHGLRRWSRLLELMQQSARPKCGFLLHSYGGPAELIPAFAKIGGYFSCSGSFLRPGHDTKLVVFRRVPRDRLVIETDAPDQVLPERLDTYLLKSATDSARINHPANIASVYCEVATVLGYSLESLCRDVERNFLQLFDSVIRKAA